MKKIIIFGAGNIGKKLIKEIERTGKVIIEGFADNAENAILEGYSKIDINDKKYIDLDVIIAVSIDTPYFLEEIYNQLRRLGYKNIFWYNGTNYYGKDNEQFGNIRLVSCQNWGDNILAYVEMHIVDYCNLNCKACTHFSAIFPTEIPDLNKRCNGLEKLAKLFSHIVILRIMEGEPLLNPELGKYIQRIRKILPQTEIALVTNGLLIPKIDIEILKCIKENNIIVHISGYQPTLKIIKTIINKLEKYKVEYVISDEVKTFVKPLSLSENSIYKRCCSFNDCTNIYEEKIARCPALMYIDKFNEVFNTNLPNEGIMRIDDFSSGVELLKKLREEVPLCKHCVENIVEWSVCEKDVKLEDFAVTN